MIQSPRPEPVKLGLGYRELKTGEAKQLGDEFTVGAVDIWVPIPEDGIGSHITETSVRHRRKIEAEGQKAA